MPKPKRDIYQEVTDQVIKDIEDTGLLPWEKPWKYGRLNNPTTGTFYRGTNVWTLMIAADKNGWTSPGFIGFKAAKAAGLSVKKGSKGSQVVYWNRKKYTTTETDEETGETSIVKRTGWTMFCHWVFNLDQMVDTDGTGALERLRKKAGAIANDNSKIAAPQAIIDATGANIEHRDQDQAYYRPSTDQIVLPLLQQFRSSERYYGTAFHELCHWTGATSRLDRGLSKGRFGNEHYAREELIAEMGAALLCGVSGIEYMTQHASYLKSWLSVLKTDKKAFIHAAQRAQKASDYILKFSEASKVEDAA